MSLKTNLVKLYADFVAGQIRKWSATAITDQRFIQQNLLQQAQNTRFGIDHDFAGIKDYTGFVNHIPIRDYEDFKPYIDRILQGEENVLWKGKPSYLAKTSGTTSGIKYIPISKESIPNHIGTAKAAMMNYISQTGNVDIFKGKMVFLSGSPELESKANIFIGRLSGIVHHEMPAWIRPNKLPSYDTNCIEDWESKLLAIIAETRHQNMTLISGIPPWVQMYFEQLLQQSGKANIKELFPNFSLFMYGGVNFEPYRLQLETLIGGSVDSIELYPASEGFIAFQDNINDPSLLLNTKSGIFFEFIPASEYYQSSPPRLSLEDVQIGVDYVILITNNAGLWSYNLGDTVRFTTLNPFKITVSGRIKHFISAFGEHVIGKEVEEAMRIVSAKYLLKVNEFTVSPQVNPAHGELPYHEWLIEFADESPHLNAISKELDHAMIQQNIYYKDLRDGNILQQLKISSLKKDSFIRYMKEEGKLGGQNKVPRLSNDRKIADKLLSIQ